MKHGIALLATTLVFSLSCSGDPLLTDLRTNNLKVIIKGTYESDNPRPWFWPSTFNSGNIRSGSIAMHPVEISSKPDTFMIDIIGMDLTGPSIKTARFANHRRTYSCGADDNNAAFFNGEGITINNDDVPAEKNYTHARLYLRKILFSDAQRYNLSAIGWEPGIDFITYFREQKTNAFNFNLQLVRYFYDTLRENYSINRIYPLTIDISNGLTFDPKEEMVLEIRLVIKNFVKLYEYNHLDYSSDKPYVVHYFGVSDWLREVRAGEHTIGGNLLASARTYVIGKTGTVRGTIVGARYVIGIPAGANIDDYTMPPLGGDSTLRSNKIKSSNIPTWPIEAYDSVPARLLYYMQVEKFKSDWNEFIKSVNTNSGDPDLSQEFFENEWTEYNEAAENFKIPPLAAYCGSGGTYEIANIAPGEYDFYYSGSELAWGELFRYNAFTPATDGIGITINANSNLLNFSE
ncbi:MAG: hypothetical protein FWG92_02840 [Leptospirales bacterium]|nr:hypothetical protein [Leptospirales bacterium]